MNALLAGPSSVFITLRVAGQLCGMPVTCVRDVLGAQPITPVPLASAEIVGILNLRGRIVTAIDLRRRLRLPDEPTRQWMAVVIEQKANLYALLVDQVHEVLTLDARQVEPNPATLPSAWSRLSQGVCRLEDSLMVMLDVDRLLAIAPENV